MSISVQNTGNHWIQPAPTTSSSGCGGSSPLGGQHGSSAFDAQSSNQLAQILQELMQLIQQLMQQMGGDQAVHEQAQGDGEATDDSCGCSG